MVRAHRHGPAAVERAGQHEVQGPDVGQLVAGDRALHQAAVVLLHPFRRDLLAQQPVAVVVVCDQADVAGVALVAGAAVSVVDDARGHPQTSTISTDWLMCSRGTRHGHNAYSSLSGGRVPTPATPAGPLL